MIRAFKCCSQHLLRKVYARVLCSSLGQCNREPSSSSSHFQYPRTIDYARDEFLLLLIDVSSAKTPKSDAIIIRSVPIIVGLDNGSRSDSLYNQDSSASFRVPLL